MRITEAERLEAIALVRKIYSSPGGSAGCCLHVILDDGNTEDCFVLGERPYEIEHEHCRRLLELLGKMKQTQRNKVIRQGQQGEKR